MIKLCAICEHLRGFLFFKSILYNIIHFGISYKFYNNNIQKKWKATIKLCAICEHLRGFLFFKSILYNIIHIIKK
jgi:hypothetical protein